MSVEHQGIDIHKKSKIIKNDIDSLKQKFDK